MIKNIIFDLGNVLISFQPKEYFTKIFLNEARAVAMINCVFKHKYWSDLDKGILTEEEATELFCQDAPHLESDIRQGMRMWKDMLVPIPETVHILEELKEAGYQLFVLSNYPREAFERTSSGNDFFNLFDGTVISYTVGMTKPQKEIYEYLLQRYALTAQETLFIDDLEENIMGAEKLNIHTILFRSSNQLGTYIREYLKQEIN